MEPPCSEDEDPVMKITFPDPEFVNLPPQMPVWNPMGRGENDYICLEDLKKEIQRCALFTKMKESYLNSNSKYWRGMDDDKFSVSSDSTSASGMGRGRGRGRGRAVSRNVSTPNAHQRGLSPALSSASSRSSRRYHREHQHQRTNYQPNQFESAEEDQIQTEQSQFEPKQFEPRRFKPKQFESKQFAPNQFESAEVDHNQTEQSQFEPSQFELNQLEPNHSRPLRFERHHFVPSEFESNQFKPIKFEPAEFEGTLSQNAENYEERSTSEQGQILKNAFDYENIHPGFQDMVKSLECELSDPDVVIEEDDDSYELTEHESAPQTEFFRHPVHSYACDDDVRLKEMPQLISNPTSPDVIENIPSDEAEQEQSMTEPLDVIPQENSKTSPPANIDHLPPDSIPDDAAYEIVDLLQDDDVVQGDSEQHHDVYDTISPEISDELSSRMADLTLTHDINGNSKLKNRSGSDRLGTEVDVSNVDDLEFNSSLKAVAVQRNVQHTETLEMGGANFDNVQDDTKYTGVKAVGDQNTELPPLNASLSSATSQMQDTDQDSTVYTSIMGDDSSYDAFLTPMCQTDTDAETADINAVGLLTETVSHADPVVGTPSSVPPVQQEIPSTVSPVPQEIPSTVFPVPQEIPSTVSPVLPGIPSTVSPVPPDDTAAHGMEFSDDDFSDCSLAEEMLKLASGEGDELSTVVVDGIPRSVPTRDVEYALGNCGEIFNISFDLSHFSDEHTAAYVVMTAKGCDAVIECLHGSVDWGTEFPLACFLPKPGDEY